MELDFLCGDVDYGIKDDIIKFEFLLGIIIWPFFSTYWEFRVIGILHA